MIYVFHGSKTLDKFNKLIENLLKKKPDASIFKINSESYSPDSLQELIQGQGLFEKKYVVSLNGLLQEEEILSNLKEIAESENIFVFWEESIDKKTLKKLEKYSEKISGIEDIKEKKETFNMFSFSDSLGKRDKKQLWILYQRALQQSVRPEEIHGIFVWQAKSMILASSTDSAKEANMKEFPYNKAKGYAKNFTKEELQSLLRRLVSIYHDSRRGIHEFDVAMEKFVLEV